MAFLSFGVTTGGTVFEVDGSCDGAGFEGAGAGAGVGVGEGSGSGSAAGGGGII